MGTTKGLAYYNHTPVGDLVIESEDDTITRIGFLKEQRETGRLTPVIELCIRELEEYFSRGRKFFTFNLGLRGTEFQNRVWKELLNIPYGTTISYEELAIRLGDIKSIRAVGLANGQNPVAIVVPCHRVIGKNGSLTGYGGGLENKQWLLEHEGAVLKQLSLF
ncbi:MAG: methylated-DNA--[protein]-cysteine S-methyltransferase [Cyclobacteriaceae bacterium]|nr:methylated-DNA--[protein]-cysteine S-methyltransferase [Cyclobacteriaceae bacterium]